MSFISHTSSMGKESSSKDDPFSSAGLVLLYAPRFAQHEAAYPFGADVVTIGREPLPSGICLDESAVSRLHARIALRAERWVVRDLESRNGTYVNGRRVEEAVLEDFDVVRIGDAIFRYVGAGIQRWAG